jgi:hypothetical protein
MDAKRLGKGDKVDKLLTAQAFGEADRRGGWHVVVCVYWVVLGGKRDVRWDGLVGESSKEKGRGGERIPA